MTGAEAADILKRTTTVDLVKLLAIKAADGMRRGDGSQTYQAECTTDGVAGHITAVVRVRITKKREPKRAGSRTPNESRKGAA